MRSVLLAALLIGSTSLTFAQSAGRAPGMRDGVQVHGDWVIDVRNPDGTLAHRHAFKNALVGGWLLTAIMARGAVPGKWGVFLSGDACSNACVLSETAGNLTVALSSSGTEMTLTGTVTATNPQASQFVEVATTLALCPPTAVPRRTAPQPSTARSAAWCSPRPSRLWRTRWRPSPSPSRSLNQQAR